MPFPHQIKRKTAPNLLNKVSIRLQEIPHWIFLFHRRLSTSCANLRVATTSVRSQLCFKCNLVQKVVGTPSHAFPLHYSPGCIVASSRLTRTSSEQSEHAPKLEGISMLPLN